MFRFNEFVKSLPRSWNDIIPLMVELMEKTGKPEEIITKDYKKLDGTTLDLSKDDVCNQCAHQIVLENLQNW
jgi:hypothetical protein